MVEYDNVVVQGEVEVGQAAVVLGGILKRQLAWQEGGEERHAGAVGRCTCGCRMPEHPAFLAFTAALA
jgi:hypothetical protein